MTNTTPLGRLEPWLHICNSAHLSVRYAKHYSVEKQPCHDAWTNSEFAHQGQDTNCGVQHAEQPTVHLAQSTKTQCRVVQSLDLLKDLQV